MEWITLGITAGILLFFGRERQKKQPTDGESKEPSQGSVEVRATVTYEDTRRSDVLVSGSEIEEALKPYQFVYGKKPEPLKKEHIWYDEKAQKRNWRNDPKKAYEWVLPFLPRHVAEFEEIRSHVQRGPDGAAAIVKSLRAIVRKRRKAGQPYADVLKAMYNAAVLADLGSSLRVLGNYNAARIAGFMDIRELQNTPIDYVTIGIDYLDTPLKTDRKWYVEKFGEPRQHQPAVELYAEARENAIARYCWDSVKKENTGARSLGWPEKSIEEWLKEVAERQLRYHKEWVARTKEREAEKTIQTEIVGRAIEATRRPFAVADLETTGLDAGQHEITEMAALLVNPDGTITSHFCSLVKIQKPIPSEITELTGIDDNMLASHGRQLAEVLPEFLSQIEGRPVFFHHAKFDSAFLESACQQCKLRIENEVFDTLAMARQAWPHLGRYKLATLAEFLGFEQPRHRATEDARATLAVLLASRRALAEVT